MLTTLHIAIGIVCVVWAILIQRRSASRKLLYGNEVWPLYVGAAINFVAAINRIF